MHIQTRLEPEVLEAAREAAAREGTNLSEYLRRLIQADLEKRLVGGQPTDEDDGQGQRVIS